MRRLVPALPALLLLLCVGVAGAASGQPAQDRVDRLELRWWAQDAPDGIYDLTLTPDGLLWAATGDGLLRLDGVETTRLAPWLDGTSSAEPQTKPRPTRAVAPDGTGALVVATDDGAYRFDGRRFVLLSRPGVGGRPWPARLLHLDRNRVLWVAASDTLLRLEPDAYSLRQGLPGVSVSLLWEDPYGFMWATTESGQVFRRLDNSFQPVNFPLGMGSVHVQCLHLDAEGYLWLVRSDRSWQVEGDFAGAGLPRGAKPLEALDGLQVQTCSSDSDTGVWLGTGHALYYQTPDGGRAAVPGLDAEIRKILVASDGDIWVGTDQGIAQLHDPQTVPPPPKVLVISAWLDDDEVLVSDTFDLEASVEQLRLKLSAPSFHQPAEVRMRYRWDDEDATGWKILNGTELVLHDVPAGRHSLTLQAGVGERWRESGTKLLIIKKPKLWQTQTFWGAVGAGLAALLVWWLYLRRTGPGPAPMEERDDFDEDIVHLEDLDTDELRVSQENVDRAKRNIFGED